MTKQTQMNLQLWVALVLTLSGIILLFAGFWVKPLGEIHNSVLIAFGEMSTFAGALFGVDYSYRYRYSQRRPSRKKPQPDISNQTND